MDKSIFICSSAIETRIALAEKNQLAEIQVESAGADRSVAGNMYKGRVLRVLPGMQAAFVDIGLEKAAFMHVSDFWDPPRSSDDEAIDDGEERSAEDESESLLAYVESEAEADEAASDDAPEDDESEGDEAEDAPEAEGDGEADAEGDGEADAEGGGAADAEGEAPEDGADEEEDAEEDASGPTRPPIEELLQKGQEIIVQVSKEPIGTKGARITSHISLPGRYVVYMPTTDHIGVSRRIEDEKERKRLKEIVADRRPAQGGWIVRTACEGVSKREIAADMRFLARLWARIQKKSEGAGAPSLLHEDLDLILRAIRDLFTSDVTQVVVDRPEHHARIVEFMDGVLQPRLKSRVKLYEGKEPIFDHFGLENQVRRALDRRVWLKSGGYLVFDQTEALTAVDVNTGRFVGKRTHEETVLKTNLEAATVVIDQLRLRNVGGIIVIDFIDMECLENRKKVSDALAEAVKRDKARTNILRISELGLVQMTRKRTRDNLRQLMTVPCPDCDGNGRLKSIEALAAEALRLVRRRAASTGKIRSARVRVSSPVANALGGPLREGKKELESDLGIRVTVEGRAAFERDQVEVELREGRTRERRKSKSDSAAAGQQRESS